MLRRAAPAAAMIFAALSGVGAADPVGPCMMTGKNGEFRVVKFTFANWGDLTGYRSFHVFQTEAPFTTKEGHALAYGFFLINATTGQLLNWDVELGGAGAPGAIVKVNGTPYYEDKEDKQSPATAASGMHGGRNAIVGGTLPGGTYYAVAFVRGAPQGFLGPSSDWWVQFNVGLICTPVAADGEILRYNQTDFTGPTHIYAGIADVGTGTNLTLDYDVPATRNTVLGSLFAGVDNARNKQSVDIGSINLRYWTPTESGAVGSAPGTANDDPIPFFSTDGHYHYRLDYFGLEPLADISFLQVDLP